MRYQSSELRKLEKYSTDCSEVRISFILIAIFLYLRLYRSVSRHPSRLKAHVGGFRDDKISVRVDSQIS